VVSMTDQKRQEAVNKTFQGKTIKSVEASAVNAWTFFFTDGTSVKLWAEDAVYTPYGNIPGLVLGEGS
jgi:hypothetical protein